MNSPGVMPALSLRKVVWLAVKLAVFGLVVFFLVRVLVDRFRAVDWHAVRPDPGCLIAVVALLLVSAVVSGAAYRMLLAAFGYALGWPTILAIVWVSQLGKYVPGRLVSVAGGMWMLKRQNVPLSVGGVVNLILMGLYVVLGAMVASPLLVMGAVAAAGPVAWAGLAAVVACGAAALHPRIFLGIINIVLRRLGRQTLDYSLGLRHYLGPIFLVLLQWFLMGAVIWFAGRSVGSVPAERLWYVIAATALAVTLGFVAVFAPGGLGVREGLLLVLLSPLLGDAQAALVVVSVRFLQVVVESLLAAAGLVILRLSAADTPDAGSTP